MGLKISILVLAFALAITAEATAENGAALFESLKCNMCHKPDKKAAAISLAEIGKTYSDKDQLVKFFNGEIKPLIESEKYGMMRPQLQKIKALPNDKKEELAEYVLSFK